LTLNLVAEEYSRLKYVHVVDALPRNLAGLARDCDAVTLEWNALQDGAGDEGDGYHVGYHEFAHVLDASDGAFDGVPPLLLDPSLRETWKAVLRSELERLRAAVALGIPTVLDAAATKAR
jgi:Mlc titration factor MtfA (ptsG expression regulator)